MNKNLKMFEVKQYKILVLLLVMYFSFNGLLISQCHITDTDGDPPGTMDCGVGFGFCSEPSQVWCFGSSVEYTNVPQVQPAGGYPSGECSVAYLMFWASKIPFGSSEQNIFQHAIFILQGENASQYEPEAQVYADMAVDVCTNGIVFNLISMEYDHCGPGGIAKAYYNAVVETNGFFKVDNDFGVEFDPNNYFSASNVVVGKQSGTHTFTVKLSVNPDDYGALNQCNDIAHDVSCEFTTYDTDDMEVDEYHTTDPTCQVVGQSLWTGGAGDIAATGYVDVWPRGRTYTSVCDNGEFYLDVCISGDPNYQQYEIGFYDEGANGGNGAWVYKNGSYTTTEHFGPFVGDINGIEYITTGNDAPHCVYFQQFHSSPCQGQCTIGEPTINVNCFYNSGDQYFEYTINTPVTDAGSTYSISGDDTQANLNFGQTEGPFGPFAVSGGSLNITLTSTSNGSCPLDVVVSVAACGGCPVPDCLDGTLIKD